jgi:hypothetical protein
LVLFGIVHLAVTLFSLASAPFLMDQAPLLRGVPTKFHKMELLPNLTVQKIPCIPYQIYQPASAGNLPILANLPVKRWDATLDLSHAYAPASCGLVPTTTIPSSKIALTTQKLSIYPTLKLTTHMLPWPKTQLKTHHPQRSCVSTGSCCMSHSRNRMVVWRLVSECAKKT